MNKLKILLILFVVLISQIASGQEKLSDFQLSPQEEEVLNAHGRIVRESRTYTDWDNAIWKGKVELVKVNGRIEFNKIGPWYQYYKDGEVKEKYIYDDKGYLRKFDFYEKNGFNLYACTYRFKEVDEIKYRLEYFKLFFLSGGLREEGVRYNTIKTENGIVKRSSPRHIGLRTFYDEDGEIIRQKIKRGKLAKRLEIMN